MGLRSEKKKRIREKILKVSNELFLNNGYENTTTDQIAEKANIGVGTLYNYFDSKADIFLEVFAEQQTMVTYETMEVGIPTVDYAIDVIIKQIMKRMGRICFFPKSILQDLIMASLGLYKKHPELLKKMMKTDYVLMDKISGLLEKMKEKGMISKNKDSQELTELIYGAMTYEFILYLYEEKITMEECLEKIRRKMKLILE